MTDNKPYCLEMEKYQIYWQSMVMMVMMIYWET